MTTTPTFWSDEITIVPAVNFGILPKVTALADGSFIFGWEENPTANIHARHLDHFGSFIPGGDFLSSLSGSTNDPLSRPFFAQEPGGAVVVAYDTLPTSPGGKREVRWHEATVDSTGNSTSVNVVGPGADSIVYDITTASTGSAIAFTQVSGGSEFGTVWFLDGNGAMVAGAGGPITNGGVAGLAMAALSNGNVALTWTDTNPAQDQIKLQIYTTTGPQGEKVVSTPGVGSGRPEVAVTNGGTLDTAGDGEIVVVFDNSNGIQFRRYTEAGAPIDLTPLTITGTVGSTLAAVTHTHDGGFVVAWQQAGDIVLQRFDENGSQVGDRVPISSPGLQINPDLTTLDDGRILLAFQDETATASGLFTLDYVILDPRELTISGSNTADTIVGRLEASTVFGLGGDDRLFGNDAADTLVGGVGADDLDGGDGSDTASYATSSAGVIVVLGTGSGSGGDAAGDFLVSVENLVGSLQDDQFFGDDLENRLDGSDGADELRAGEGLDVLIGGLGADRLFGGADSDRFDFDSVLDIGKKKGLRDVLGDFDHKSDLIDLSTIDANGTKKGDKAFKFVKKEGADFTGKAGQLIWDKIDKKGSAKDVTLVQGDTNGNGKADFTLELTGLHKLSKVDLDL